MSTTMAWIHGFVAGLLGGVVTTLAAALSSKITLDELIVLLVTFVVSGSLIALAYLKQSPLPEDWDGTERRTQR